MCRRFQRCAPRIWPPKPTRNCSAARNSRRSTSASAPSPNVGVIEARAACSINHRAHRGLSNNPQSKTTVSQRATIPASKKFCFVASSRNPPLHRRHVRSDTVLATLLFEERADFRLFLSVFELRLVRPAHFLIRRHLTFAMTEAVVAVAQHQVARRLAARVKVLVACLAVGHERSALEVETLEGNSRAGHGMRLPLQVVAVAAQK